MPFCKNYLLLFPEGALRLLNDTGSPPVRDVFCLFFCARFALVRLLENNYVSVFGRRTPVCSHSTLEQALPGSHACHDSVHVTSYVSDCSGFMCVTRMFLLFLTRVTSVAAAYSF